MSGDNNAVKEPELVDEGIEQAEAPAEQTPEQKADQAYQIVVQAVSAAMAGKFPTGIEAVESNLQIKGALQYLGAELKKAYAPAPESN